MGQLCYSHGYNQGMIGVFKMVRDPGVEELHGETTHLNNKQEAILSRCCTVFCFHAGSNVLPKCIDNATVEFMEQSGPLLVSKFKVYIRWLYMHAKESSANPMHRRFQRTACMCWCLLEIVSPPRPKAKTAFAFVFCRTGGRRKYMYIHAGYLKACMYIRGAKLY